jgi:hypothetical protein
MSQKIAPLSPDQVLLAADALVRIGWMSNGMSERNHKSTKAIRAALNCGADDAHRIWRDLWYRNIVDLRSEFNLAESGCMNNRWGWCAAEGHAS